MFVYTIYNREIRWEKSISLGEAPGFLHSWWCVFWDLYCAAPERREHNEHSSEAKAFHDYGFVAGQQNNGASAPPPPPAAPQYINGIQHVSFDLLSFVTLNANQKSSVSAKQLQSIVIIKSKLPNQTHTGVGLRNKSYSK